MIVILVSELFLGTRHRDAVLRIIRNRSKAQIYDGHSGPLFIFIGCLGKGFAPSGENFFFRIEFQF